MSGKAATSAVNAAAAAVGTKASASSAVNRYLVAPVMSTLCKVEAKYARRCASVEADTAQWIQSQESKGADAASSATKQFVHMQRQLMSYRVVRFFGESRHVLSGEYFKRYSWAKAVDDARFLTQLFFLFLCGVMLGRRSVFPPIAPDSPFALALDHKVNPNY